MLWPGSVTDENVQVKNSEHETKTESQTKEAPERANRLSTIPISRLCLMFWNKFFPLLNLQVKNYRSLAQLYLQMRTRSLSWPVLLLEAEEWVMISLPDILLSFLDSSSQVLFDNFYAVDGNLKRQDCHVCFPQSNKKKKNLFDGPTVHVQLM